MKPLTEAVRAAQRKQRMHDHGPELYAACAALVDVLVRCDAETKSNHHCTGDEWDQALAQGKAALEKVDR